MAGKDKVERSFRLYFDDSGSAARDLSGDLVPGSCALNLGQEQVELTGVSDTVKNALAGHKEAPVVAKFFMNDTATTGSHTVLKGVEGSGGTLTLQWGADGAAPTTDDPEWEGEYVYFPQGIAFEGGKAVISALFVPQTGQSAPAMGTVA